MTRNIGDRGDEIKADDLSQARVQELLIYEPETGIFRWKADRKGKGNTAGAAGSVAGCVHRTNPRNSYRSINIDGRNYRAHRLAWLYVHGRWPVADIDHVNCDSLDNRLSNLREATRSQNCGNARLSLRNKSGSKGVCHIARTGKWRASIMISGKYRHLGYFANKDAAAAAYEAAAKAGFGEFARTASGEIA